jgi:hypothetical protein
MMKRIFLAISVLGCLAVSAQIPDHIYHKNIRTVKLNRTGDIYSYPVLSLNSGEQLELHFDDLEADVKNYYYTFQLCNADWQPANIQSFDYIRGFQTNRISNYRYSSISYTPYTHYQAFLPERNSAPTRSGNYLLKVFLNDDTSKLAFTKRFLIVDNKASVAAQVQQPLGSDYFRTHQRVPVAVNTAAARINTFSPQDLKVVIVQNNIWATASMMDRPSIFRGNYYEYYDDSKTTFPAGKEWRWLDLRSLQLLSDRMDKIIDTAKTFFIAVKPDVPRHRQVYVFYNDLDGMYTVENRDGNNPYWQSDYALTHFVFVPPDNRPIEGKDLYIYGELTNYSTDETAKMIFDEATGTYQVSLLLKQGYYNYTYVTMNAKKGSQDEIPVSYDNTEGHFWGTENNYMVLVYYRPFGARADELIGFARINSPFQR